MKHDKKLLRNLIEDIFGEISDELFKEALKETQNDIRQNISRFGKKADLKYVLEVMVIYINMVHRYCSTDVEKESEKQAAESYAA